MSNNLTFMLDVPYQLWQKNNSNRFKQIDNHELPIFEPPTHFPLLTNDIAYTDGGLKTSQDIHFQYAYDVRYVLRLPSSYKLSDGMEAQLSSELPFYAQRIMEQTQKRLLLKIYDCINAITALTNLDELLSKMIDTTMEVIPEADVGVLWVYDEEEKCLKVRKASSLVDNKTMKHMRMKPGEGMIGSVFQEGEAKIYQTSSEVFQASANMSNMNLRYLGRAYSFKDVKSVICAPVKVQQKTKCVLILYQFKQATFDKSELELLKNFADQISIALHNSNIFEAMQKQNHLLQKRTEIHERLVKLSLENKGIYHIKHALEKIIGFSFSLIDAFHFSIDEDENEAFYLIDKHLEKWNDSKSLSTSFYVRSPKNYLHQVYPIVGSSTCLGYVVFEAKMTLSSTQRMVLEQGIPILALEFTHRQTETNNQFKVSEEAFQHLLLAKTNAELLEAAKKLKLEKTQPVFALIFEVALDMNPTFINLYMQRFLHFLKNQLEKHLHVLYTQDSSIITLLKASTAQEAEMLVSKVLSNTSVRARAGIGGRAVQFGQISKSYKEAYKALNQLQEKKVWNKHLNFKDIGINQLFLSHSEDEIRSFVDDFFEPIMAPNGNDSHLVETLQIYMQHNQSMQETAKALHIHVNTLYQRIHKIESALQISLKDSEDVLNAQLACYLKEHWVIDA
ncbi:helix-turn-helix domain-containing protein [Oceanobacillus sp. FSL W7-1293]|uniref:helix-turn-helix domain-containing protein n=1 Tax=Oceanobacillus sp. FSL W7-1293 TaxID=2921699 RepID=UPI0030D04791